MAKSKKNVRYTKNIKSKNYTKNTKSKKYTKNTKSKKKKSKKRKNMNIKNKLKKIKGGANKEYSQRKKSYDLPYLGEFVNYLIKEEKIILANDVIERKDYLEFLKNIYPEKNPRRDAVDFGRCIDFKNIILEEFKTFVKEKYEYFKKIDNQNNKQIEIQNPKNLFFIWLYCLNGDDYRRSFIDQLLNKIDALSEEVGIFHLILSFIFVNGDGDSVLYRNYDKNIIDGLYVENRDTLADRIDLELKKIKDMGKPEHVMYFNACIKYIYYNIKFIHLDNLKNTIKINDFEVLITEEQFILLKKSLFHKAVEPEAIVQFLTGISKGIIKILTDSLIKLIKVYDNSPALMYKCLLSELKNRGNKDIINDKIINLNTMIEESDLSELIFSIKNSNQ